VTRITPDGAPIASIVRPAAVSTCTLGSGASALHELERDALHEMLRTSERGEEVAAALAPDARGRAELEILETVRKIGQLVDHDLGREAFDRRAHTVGPIAPVAPATKTRTER
jgi:hypothetical protein